MITGTDTLPDITRSGVDIVAVSRWDTASAAEQRASADALMENLARTPPPGMLTVSCFRSTSGASNVGFLRGTQVGDARQAEALRAIAYSQWASRAAYRGFLQTQQPNALLGAAPAAPAAAAARRRSVSAEYRLYRSHQNIPQDTTPRFRSIVIVTIDFDGPDGQRLRRWIDGVVDALEAEPHPIPGMIRAHFHASTDGNQVLNYAEWTSERAYDEALADGPGGVGQTDLPEWRKVRAFPGVTANTVTRYTLHRGLVLRQP
jgi:hypothetical protein